MAAEAVAPTARRINAIHLSKRSVHPTTHEPGLGGDNHGLDERSLYQTVDTLRFAVPNDLHSLGSGEKQGSMSRIRLVA